MSTEPTSPELDCRALLAPGERQALFAIASFWRETDKAWGSYVKLACVITSDGVERAADSNST